MDFTKLIDYFSILLDTTIYGTGIAFDSSGGFKLPNGADRPPDASWVRLDRWNALTPEQRQKFPPHLSQFCR